MSSENPTAPDRHAQATTQSWSADVFERLYAERPDPWDLAGSEYERAKHAATVAALPAARFADGLELGCSIGVLTRLLAARCERLLSVDFAEAALVQARARCRDLAHVRFERRTLPAEWPEGSYDLVVASEVLYFLDAAAVARVAAACCRALRPGGVVVLVNWTGETDTPCTGEEAASAFVAACAGRLRAGSPVRAPEYRLDVLQG